MSKKIGNTFDAAVYDNKSRACSYCELKKFAPCLFINQANSCKYLKHKIKKAHE